MAEAPIFYYDLSSPYAYLAATRVDSVMPVLPDWQPIALRAALTVASAEVKDRLRAATDLALEHGVSGVPTVKVGGELFWGDDRLEQAAVACA